MPGPGGHGGGGRGPGGGPGGGRGPGGGFGGGPRPGGPHGGFGGGPGMGHRPPPMHRPPRRRPYYSGWYGRPYGGCGCCGPMVIAVAGVVALVIALVF